jgi:hypothetical protein
MMTVAVADFEEVGMRAVVRAAHAGLAFAAGYGCTVVELGPTAGSHADVVRVRELDLDLIVCDPSTRIEDPSCSDRYDQRVVGVIRLPCLCRQVLLGQSGPKGQAGQEIAVAVHGDVVRAEHWGK